jgi:ribosome biogenesis GTPase
MITIDFDALRSIGLNNQIAAQLATLDTAPTDRLMRITRLQREGLTLHDGSMEYAARPLPKLYEGDLAVGDWVVAQEREQGEWWATARLAPVTQITRRANDGRRQLIVTNIDTALLVMGLDDDFNPRRVERYIAMVQAADIAPVVVLTKTDIGRDIATRVSQLQDRLPNSIPIIFLNALSKQDCGQLAPWLQTGQTVCLLGASGTGKSTLTNSLTLAQQSTGGVRKSDGRGMHTTTGRSLHICRDGACLIDTPGLRTWRPDTDEQTLAATFDDIELLASRCQFRDCTHRQEPQCAVRSAIDPDRLANYHKLLRDVRRSDQTPLQRIAERAKWKTLEKAAAARLRLKHE